MSRLFPTDYPIEYLLISNELTPSAHNHVVKWFVLQPYSRGIADNHIPTGLVVHQLRVLVSIYGSFRNFYFLTLLTEI